MRFIVMSFLVVFTVFRLRAGDCLRRRLWETNRGERDTFLQVLGKSDTSL
jgi:hypothetical protein